MVVGKQVQDYNYPHPHNKLAFFIKRMTCHSEKLEIKLEFSVVFLEESISGVNLPKSTVFLSSANKTKMRLCKQVYLLPYKIS